MHLSVFHVQNAVHQIVGLGDELHHAVFDAVVNHFDEMARGTAAHVGDARFAVHFGGDGLKRGGDTVVMFATAAGHDAGTVTRSFFAAADADAHETDAFGFKLSNAAVGVGVMRVSTVDDEVVFVEQRSELADNGVDDRPGGHKQHNVARRFELGEEISEINADFERHAGAFVEQELPFRRVEVVSNTRNAVLSDIKQKIPAHRAESDHSEVSFHMRILTQSDQGGNPTGRKGELLQQVSSSTTSTLATARVSAFDTNCVNLLLVMKSLHDAIRPTTIIRSSKLNDHLGLDVTIASEAFQHTGSFKFRAAYNVVLNNDVEEFIGVSSGNFGQALAYACKLLNRKCTVIMPANSASVKVNAVRAFGATADLIDVSVVSRAERLKQLAAEHPNAYLASAYDDQLVIDGNSTLGDELAEHNFDAVIVPIGGGGLISGIIQSFCRNGVTTEVIGAEPAMANDAARSLAAGHIIANESEPQTIADGTRTLSVGKLNWPIIQNGLKTIVEVSEENIRSALKLYFGLVNLKCEPTGALSLGALLENKEIFDKKRVCLVVSGGNVNANIYAEMII